MNGFTIQQSTCRACGNKRTVRLGFARTTLCLNCRKHESAWSAEKPSVAYAFTPSELLRLSIYRRAAAAGFYSDWS
jgi:hypothetical protein